jgi:hypothetical protein
VAKIGDGHVSGMGRQGLKELRAAVFFTESNIASQTEYGIYGTKTPGEVAESREGAKDADEEKPLNSSLIADRLPVKSVHSADKQPERGLDR